LGIFKKFYKYQKFWLYLSCLGYNVRHIAKLQTVSSNGRTTQPTTVDNAEDDI